MEGNIANLKDEEVGLPEDQKGEAKVEIGRSQGDRNEDPEDGTKMGRLSKAIGNHQNPLPIKEQSPDLYQWWI